MDMSSSQHLYLLLTVFKWVNVSFRSILNIGIQVGSATVTVDVTNVNDNQPRFLQTSYTFSVLEGLSNELVGTVEVSFNTFVYNLHDTHGLYF